MFSFDRPAKPAVAMRSKSTRARVASTLAGACLAGLIMPLAAALPAQAATTKYGCTMTPYKPHNSGVKDPYDGRSIVFFTVKMKCDRAAKVKVQIRAMENDGAYPGQLFGGDDQFAYTEKTLYLQPNIAAYTPSWAQRVPDFDSDSRADVYQRVRFAVQEPSWLGGNWHYSPWENSAETVIPLY